MQVRYRYVHADVDRHGNRRIYFWRRPGAKVRITEPIGSPAFAARYQELLDGKGTTTEAGVDRVKPGTLRWLVSAYVTSTAFRSLDSTTQRIRRQTLEHCCREPLAPGRSECFAEFPLDRVGTKALRVLRDRKAGLPEAANGRVKALRGLFRWGLAEEHVAGNPARDLERIAHASTGTRPWTLDDVTQFEARHPVGSKARLAMAILLYTGMRRSDAVQFGPPHVQDGWISKPQFKGRTRHAQRIEVPMLEPLARIIEQSSTGPTTWLVTEYGHPFTIAGFGNWFRDRCDEAGLRGLSAHGLRKAGATRAADAGASTHTLMSMFGWRSMAEAETYTKAADRKRLARDGMALIVSVPTKETSGNNKPKKRYKTKA